MEKLTFLAFSYLSFLHEQGERGTRRWDTPYFVGVPFFVISTRPELVSVGLEQTIQFSRGTPAETKLDRIARLVLSELDTPLESMKKSRDETIQ